ncbi:hypothetical protein J2S74_002862 [Evansella vedderi]|uniref:Uncharacterized protein n=2 Tax=Evansella vedderi TaxID=38282 RepID=A0ABT9ZW63_9BACI|nr:hypothetical protein [Evansella vedderi]
MTLQWNIETDLTTNSYMKNYLDIAVHDAALALDDEELSRGYVVFVQDVAEENFRQSLMFHLRLNYDLSPLEDSFFQDPVEIKLLEFFDDATIDPETGEPISFPYVYHNEEYQIIDVLRGPGVVAVIEVQSPRYFRGEGMTIRKASVYEYVF